MKGNNIKPRGFELFSKGLVDNRSLTVLDMSFNDCKVDGSEALASALAENNVIQELHLRSCNIGTNGAFVLARKLRKCESLGELMIADNKVGRLGAAPRRGLPCLGICSCFCPFRGGALGAGSIRKPHARHLLMAF